ncbi:MAG: 1-acyl-sn-glycerol-3-phosphate acyltransferase [Aquificae bacterium]|nr:1-acyl-sn-glycerol-3-phosphate acyltransferase [Aquificota bacterium]
MKGCPYTRAGRLVFLPVWKAVRPLFKALVKIEAEGLERVPEGPCIVAANHRSNLDPPVLNAVFPEPLFFLAKEELFKGPLGLVMPHLRTLPVRKGLQDAKTLERALELLSRGCKLAIFPEGMRAPPGTFLRPKPGVGLLAVKSGMPVLPVLIEGTDRVLPRGAYVPRPHRGVRVVVGEPLSFKGLPHKKEVYREVAERVMEAVKALAAREPARTGKPP